MTTTDPTGSRERDQWRLIETAPKEFVRVLLLMGDGSMSVGGWAEGRHTTLKGPFWQSENGVIRGRTWCRANQPTHWMPLPVPPQEAAAS